MGEGYGSALCRCRRRPGPAVRPTPWRSDHRASGSEFRFIAGRGSVGGPVARVGCRVAGVLWRVCQGASGPQFSRCRDAHGGAWRACPRDRAGGPRGAAACRHRAPVARRHRLWRAVPAVFTTVFVAKPAAGVTPIMPLRRVTNPDDTCAGQYLEIARGIRNRNAGTLGGPGFCRRTKPAGHVGRRRWVGPKREKAVVILHVNAHIDAGDKWTRRAQNGRINEILANSNRAL